MKRLLALLMTLLLIPAAMAESAFYVDGRDADRVHLRAEPSTGAESLGLYYTGTDVTALDRQGDWSRVKIGEVSGYMMSRFLTGEQINRVGPWRMVNNFNSTWVNLRTAPSMDAGVALRPDNGTTVIVLGETSDGWSYVECQGTTGYIRTDLLSAREKKPLEAKTTILSQAGWNSCIHQYIAPNGKPIYFTSELNEPQISLEDVNFDGWDDLVIMTMTSAKSTAYQFFVYDARQDEYVYVQHSDYDGGLINYAAYPQYGVIETHATNGNAGLLHVTSLYRWEGNRLRQIRSSVSDEWSESIFEGDTYTQIIHGDILHVKVLDHTAGNDGTVIYERFFALDEVMDNEDYYRIYDEEMAALWQGLK